MKSNHGIPDTDATAAHRPELFSELRRRNERRARAAAVREGRRAQNLRLERVIQAQRERRFRQVG